jgi:hypothetical protein
MDEEATQPGTTQLSPLSAPLTRLQLLALPHEELLRRARQAKKIELLLTHFMQPPRSYSILDDSVKQTRA